MFLPSLCVLVPVLPVSLPSRSPERPVRNEGSEGTQQTPPQGAFGWWVGPDCVAQADLEFLPPSGVLELLVPGKQRDSGHKGQKFICGQSRKKTLDNSQNQRQGCHMGTYQKCHAAPHSGPHQNLLSKISRQLGCMNFSKN